MPENTFAMLEGYRGVFDYASGARVTYREFDSATQSELGLFALREDIDFEALEANLDKILHALPPLKRIFSAPIIRLRDSGEILPAEAVRVVNSKTLAHISVHSELWSNIKDGDLIPRKLMSIRYEDDYVLYENIIFARTVDNILRFTSQNLAILRDMLYANREMRFNLLERENHPSFFLALGKLHTGYLRDYDKYLLPIERCFRKLTEIEHAIIPRLSMPVYKKCRKNKSKLTLKRTNIFRSQKDYRKLYALAKFFAEEGIDTADLCESAHVSRENYSVFCSMLCTFAAGHFNFRFDEYQTIDFTNIDLDGSFGAWRLNIRAEGEGIALTVGKERTYKVLLLPMTDAVDADADEIIKVTPDGEESMRISLFDLDSFRRIQQILLRAMVYADEPREVCPFCGKMLAKTEDGYECGACRTVIIKNTCPETGEDYYLTDIKHFRKQGKRVGEGLYHFRNITPLSAEGAFLCPKCGKEH